MKIVVLLISLFITFQSYAVDICSFVETWEYQEALERAGVKTSKKSKNHKRFTALEKDMIHLTISLQDWLRGVSREEALMQFGDFYNGQLGPNAGEILYYQIGYKTFALVHYWPGDTEVGAFFELRGRAFKLIAEINDSFIECR